MTSDNGAAVSPRDELNAQPDRLTEQEQQLAECEQAVKKLREKVEMYEQILDAIADMVFSKGPQSHILYANKAFRDFYGMTMEQLRGLIDSSVNDPDYTRQYIKDDTYVFTTGQTLDIPEEPAIRHNGETFLFHTVKSPLFDHAGNVVGTVGVSRDITERKRAEQEQSELLTAAEEQLQIERDYTKLIIEGTPAIIVGITPDGTTRFVNPAIEQIGGYQPAELIGRNWWEVFYPGDDYRQVEQLYRQFEQGDVRDYEMTMTTRNGEKRVVAWNSINRYDSNGQVLEVIGFGNDITARKAAEQEQQRLQEEIIRVQEVALLELSTPLIPISDQVMVMPLIGSMDSRRAHQVMDTLLRGIVESRARTAILDITGVSVVDTQVANALLQAAQAVKLIGAQVILSGIRPEVAQTLIGLGVDLGAITTRSSLQSAISFAMHFQ